MSSRCRRQELSAHLPHLFRLAAHAFEFDFFPIEFVKLPRKRLRDLTGRNIEGRPVANLDLNQRRFVFPSGDNEFATFNCHYCSSAVSFASRVAPTRIAPET